MILAQTRLTSAGTNVLHKSIFTGVDDSDKLTEGIQFISKEYVNKFMNEVKEYLLQGASFSNANRIMPNGEQSPEECDATGFNSSNAVGLIIKFTH